MGISILDNLKMEYFKEMDFYLIEVKEIGSMVSFKMVHLLISFTTIIKEEKENMIKLFNLCIREKLTGLIIKFNYLQSVFSTHLFKKYSLMFLQPLLKVQNRENRMCLKEFKITFYVWKREFFLIFFNKITKMANSKKLKEKEKLLNILFKPLFLNRLIKKKRKYQNKEKLK